MQWKYLFLKCDEYLLARTYPQKIAAAKRFLKSNPKCELTVEDLLSN